MFFAIFSRKNRLSHLEKLNFKKKYIKISILFKKKKFQRKNY